MRQFNDLLRVLPPLPQETPQESGSRCAPQRGTEPSPGAGRARRATDQARRAGRSRTAGPKLSSASPSAATRVRTEIRKEGRSEPPAVRRLQDVMAVRPVTTSTDSSTLSPMAAPEHAELADLVRRLAVIHGRVTLSSGKEADYYVDLRRATLHHRASALIGRLMRQLTQDWDYAVVGGLTLGADPVATASCTRPGGRSTHSSCASPRKPMAYNALSKDPRLPVSGCWWSRTPALPAVLR